MDRIRFVIVHFLLLLLINCLNGAFNPISADYDAYGLKIAMNEIILVEAQNGNNPPTFLIQFAPYNDTQTALQCTINYPDIVFNYMYTVAVGKKQASNRTQFFFAGEFINGQSGAFVGVAKYNNSNSLSSTCNSFSYFVKNVSNSEHQDYYIIGVEPQGRLAYGFSNDFVFVFDSQNSSTLDSWNGNLTWPDASFIPHAVEMSDQFGVIAGFIRNAPDARVKYSPIIYLINLNSSNHHPVIVDQYKPLPNLGTWQDLLTNSDANVYSAKYDMSVSINEQGNVLVGMQFINRVFLLSVNVANPVKLNYISRNTNGRYLGNGKGVAWLQNGIAAVLVNTYSLNYQWLASQVYLYDIQNSVYNSNSTPLSIFPNNHQTLPLSLSPVFLNIISSPVSLTLLDNQGDLLIFLPTPPGFSSSIVDTGLIPLITTPQPCIPGTFKNQTGINDCLLCPTGTKNPGNASTACVPCLPESFCSLGSVDDVSQSALETTVQVIAYPKSPESTIFDEILIQNMFSIGSGRCLLVSPLFWSLIVTAIAVIIIIIMGILKVCIKHPRSRKIREIFKCIFKSTDLIREGELWVGGLASFAVVVLVSFAYAFSNAYFKQYPIENSSASTFACDTSIRNAKFDTNVQSLAIPPAYSEEAMFDLLNNQPLVMNVDFVNTLINCDAVSLQALYGTTWSTIRWSACNNTNSILSLSVALPYQHISVQFLLDDGKTIGALRVGLSGHGNENESYTLRELDFYQAFSKNGKILAQNLSVALAITKVINETAPMFGEESEYAGLYIPTFTVDMNSLFLSNDQYVRSELTLTTLTVVLSETSYYVKNVQQPIAKQSEIIFHNLLFTIVCLEIFGVVFILYKLIIKRILHLCCPSHFKVDNTKRLSTKEVNGDRRHAYSISNSNDKDTDQISYNF